MRGGLVIDGTGALPRQVDIKIENGRITEIGDIKKGSKEIDATGKTVMPGLIEGHNHPLGEREFSDPGFKKYYDNMVNSPALALMKGIQVIQGLRAVHPKGEHGHHDLDGSGDYGPESRGGGGGGAGREGEQKEQRSEYRSHREAPAKRVAEAPDREPAESGNRVAIRAQGIPPSREGVFLTPLAAAFYFPAARESRPH